MNKKLYFDLNKILSRDKKELVKDFSEYFYDYYKHHIFENKNYEGSQDKIKGYVGWVNSLFMLADGKNKRILDVGCGMGLYSTVFKILGAKEVYGMDINKKNIEIFSRLIHGMGGLKNVYSRVGNIVKTDFENDFFDAVILNEVISHLAELKNPIGEMRRILKKGGLVVIRDTNNGLNKKVVKECIEIGERAENGPVENTGLKKPYFDMRKEIIGNYKPELSNDLVDIIARETIGLWGTQIEKSVDEYLGNEGLTSKIVYKYRNPITGEFAERFFDPFVLAETFEREEFDIITIESVLPINMMRKNLRKVIKLFNPILLRYYSDSFQIVLKKA